MDWCEPDDHPFFKASIPPSSLYSIHPYLQNHPGGKYLERPPKSSNKLCLLFYLNPSSMATVTPCTSPANLKNYFCRCCCKDWAFNTQFQLCLKKAIANKRLILLPKILGDCLAVAKYQGVCISLSIRLRQNLVIKTLASAL